MKVVNCAPLRSAAQRSASACSRAGSGRFRFARHSSTKACNSSPSPSASCMARPGEPSAISANRARSAAGKSGKSRASKGVISASFNGKRSSRRQRLRMVGKSRVGAEETSSKIARAGGSSSTFRMAFCAWRFIVSAPSTITTRQPPSAAVRVMKPGISRAASTLMSLRLRSPRSVSASIVSKSAWLSAATRRNTG